MRFVVASLSVLLPVSALATVPTLEVEEQIRGERFAIAARTENAEALRAAVAAARDAVETATETVRRLNAAAGDGPRSVAPELATLIDRAVLYCRWSENRYGPLGGRLHALWKVDDGRVVRPSAPDRRRAVESATCEGVTVAEGDESVTVAADAVLDLSGFVRGFAVDRAITSLATDGVDDARVVYGAVQRAVGPGSAGEGWPLALALPSVVAENVGEPLMQDRALAVVTRGPISPLGDDAARPRVDHTTGLPVEGVQAVAASTETAVDAEGLATVLFVTGSRLGSFLLGQLRPTPSALWMQGTGSGRPLVTDYRWSRVGIDSGDGRP